LFFKLATDPRRKVLRRDHRRVAPHGEDAAVAHDVEHGTTCEVIALGDVGEVEAGVKLDRGLKEVCVTR
jgi:hypothetical protein